MEKITSTTLSSRRWSSSRTAQCTEHVRQLVLRRHWLRLKLDIISIRVHNLLIIRPETQVGPLRWCNRSTSELLHHGTEICSIRVQHGGWCSPRSP
uniref:Putative ovule protein n=1 Tax=Solanum chacoense TaxID=4108 RepID=A0A0V0GPJ6_SOLCH